MFKITEYVNASSIWPTAKDYKDCGEKPGLVRGYNIEVTNYKGATDWMSCSYIHGEPEEYFNDDFHTWMFEDYGFIPTGRICFRGYGREEYDFEEREEYVIPVEVEEEESVEEEIVEFLYENPGSGMRMIAFYIHKDPVKEVLPALSRLKNDGKVKSVMYKDMANMEFYDKWYVNC